MAVSPGHEGPSPVGRPIVVMKFGGTSVASAEGRAAIAARVTSALELEKAPVVVVSAMGRRGAPYATDMLPRPGEGLPVSDSCHRPADGLRDSSRRAVR